MIRLLAGILASLNVMSEVMLIFLYNDSDNCLFKYFILVDKYFLQNILVLYIIIST